MRLISPIFIIFFIVSIAPAQNRDKNASKRRQDDTMARRAKDAVQEKTDEHNHEEHCMKCCCHTKFSECVKECHDIEGDTYTEETSSLDVNEEIARKLDTKTKELNGMCSLACFQGKVLKKVLKGSGLKVKRVGK